MKCERVQDLLPDFSVELLDARTHGAVAAHLESCAACQAEMKALDAAVALVEEFGVRQPPPGLFNAVRNRIESGDVVRDRAPWWAWLNTRPARGLAMGMAMATVALGVLMPVGQKSAYTPLPIHPEAGQVARGELASAIRLHAMSAEGSPLPDRVAWEAMAQMVTLEHDKDARNEKKTSR